MKFNLFFSLLTHAVQGKKGPATLLLIAEYGKDPFLILISCIISLRTRDAITLNISRKLFSYATTPQQLLELSTEDLAKILYPAGFYFRKAVTLRNIASLLIEKFHGEVPHTKEELLQLPGVGIKTTNLVLAEAFDKPAICVDTHVHRLSNACGLVKTKTPEETEQVLQSLVPIDKMRDFSRYMVLLGQSPTQQQRSFIQYCKQKCL